MSHAVLMSPCQVTDEWRWIRYDFMNDYVVLHDFVASA